MHSQCLSKLLLTRVLHSFALNWGLLLEKSWKIFFPFSFCSQKVNDWMSEWMHVWAYWFIHFLVYLTYWLILWFIHSFNHSFIYWLIHLFIHFSIHWFIHLFIHSLIYSFIHSFIRSCVFWPKKVVENKERSFILITIFHLFSDFLVNKT